MSASELMIHKEALYQVNSKLNDVVWLLFGAAEESAGDETCTAYS